ncbi:hypothetical protein ABCR94_04790 [Streptomyces sp. 21So2-11]|uniref:hypothetical protein n=1 Tax=Streptomyces sp. 21So2-11 TaxID=3144408 RepID=UPI003219CDB9
MCRDVLARAIAGRLAVARRGVPYVELVGLLCLDGEAVALVPGSGTVARLLPPVVSYVVDAHHPLVAAFPGAAWEPRGRCSRSGEDRCPAARVRGAGGIDQTGALGPALERSV